MFDHLYPSWMAGLSAWEREEIELARFYVSLRHRSEGHDRLVLLAKLAALLDQSTGFTGTSLGVGHAAYSTDDLPDS